MDARFYGYTLNWLLRKEVLKKESCFALNFGYKGQLPCPQFPMNLQTDVKKIMPLVAWYTDPGFSNDMFHQYGQYGSINGQCMTDPKIRIGGPPPGQLQSKCFLVFIGGKYVDKLDAVMEKVKSVGKAVRMGAPYAVFIMKSVNTINLDPALFEGPKYSPDLNNKTSILPMNFEGPRHGQYVQPVLVIILLSIHIHSTTALTSYYLICQYHKISLNPGDHGKIGTVFRVFCPGDYRAPAHRLIMMYNGTVRKV